MARRRTFLGRDNLLKRCGKIELGLAAAVFPYPASPSNPHSCRTTLPIFAAKKCGEKKQLLVSYKIEIAAKNQII
jgi:hypothetical protein